MLNKIRPSMEPCGTPDNRILKILSASFILTLSLSLSLVFFLVSNTKILKLHWLIHINEVLQ